MVPSRGIHTLNQQLGPLETVTGDLTVVGDGLGRVVIDGVGNDGRLAAVVGEQSRLKFGDGFTFQHFDNTPLESAGGTEGGYEPPYDAKTVRPSLFRLRDELPLTICKWAVIAVAARYVIMVFRTEHNNRRSATTGRPRRQTAVRGQSAGPCALSSVIAALVVVVAVAAICARGQTTGGFMAVGSGESYAVSDGETTII